MAEPLTEEQQQKRRQAVRDLMLTTPFLAGPGHRVRTLRTRGRHHPAAVSEREEILGYSQGGV